MFDRIYLWAIKFWDFLCSEILITYLISLLVIGLSMLSIYDSVLLGWISEIHRFLLDYPICWSIIIHSTVLWSFTFLWYHCNICYFISDFIYLSLSSFLLAQLKFYLFWLSFSKQPWFHVPFLFFLPYFI